MLLRIPGQPLGSQQSPCLSLPSAGIAVGSHCAWILIFKWICYVIGRLCLNKVTLQRTFSWFFCSAYLMIVDKTLEKRESRKCMSRVLLSWVISVIALWGSAFLLDTATPILQMKD